MNNFLNNCDPSHSDISSALLIMWNEEIDKIKKNNMSEWDRRYANMRKFESDPVLTKPPRNIGHQYSYSNNHFSQQRQDLRSKIKGKYNQVNMNSNYPHSQFIPSSSALPHSSSVPTAPSLHALLSFSHSTTSFAPAINPKEAPCTSRQILESSNSDVFLEENFVTQIICHKKGKPSVCLSLAGCNFK